MITQRVLWILSKAQQLHVTRLLRHLSLAFLWLGGSFLSAFYITNPLSSASARFTLNVDDSLQITVESTTPVITFSNSDNQPAYLQGVATPTQVDEAVNKGYVDGIMPIGAVVAYMGSVIPANYLLANGETFDQSEYPVLYTVLGDNTLPDLVGYFLRGLDSAAFVDPEGATRTLGHIQNFETANSVSNPLVVATETIKHDHPSLDTSQAGSHGHSFTDTLPINWASGYYKYGSGYTSLYTNRTTVDDKNTDPSGQHSHEVDIPEITSIHSHTLNGWGAETRPKNVAVNYIIRAK